MKMGSVRRVAFAVALVCFAAAAGAKVVEKTLASVNGDAIYLSEFEKNWESYLEQQHRLLGPGQITAEWERDNRQLVLNDMIEQLILLQEARRRNVRVAKKDLEDAIRQVKDRFRVDENGRPVPPSQAEEAFKKELLREAMTEKEFEKKIEEYLQRVTLTNETIRTRVPEPKDEEIQKLFEQVKVRMAEPRPGPTKDPRQGDIDAMAQYFRMRTDESVRARHILFKVDKAAVFQERNKALQRAKEAKEKISKGEDFEELARKYSDDTASARNGGDLSFFVRGQMVQNFERVAFSLPVGGISDIVETEFGYHIIKVEEKKAPSKLRQDDVRDDLKEYIFRTAAREELEKFVADLRKKAVIEVREDFIRPL